MPRRTQGLPRPASRLRIREFHPLRCAFPCASPVMSHRLSRQPYNPIIRWFGLLRFRSPLLTESFLLSSPAGTEMFSVPCVLPRLSDATLMDGGFPHSDIDGSLPAYCSPSRFAVCCVLLRLLVSRHSTIRSSSLNLKCSFCAFLSLQLDDFDPSFSLISSSSFAFL